MNEKEHLLIRAAFKKPVERTPVWVMRQAGRYLAEYRETRKQAGSFLGLCRNPELAAEVSIQPLDLVGVDAVIMFSDILTPLEGMGMDLDFDNGPKFNNPVRRQSDIDALKIPDPSETSWYVGEILNLLRKTLGDRAPVIGFAGAPFTLASYMVEGGSSKVFSKVSSLFYNTPELAKKLMDKLTKMTINYMNYQIENGAQMIQLFDTWAGIFSAEDYRKFVFPHVCEIFAGLKDQGKVPRVYYINGGHHLLTDMAKTGADVIGLDWKADLAETKALIGNRVALQGNLNPNILFCDPDKIEERVISILNKWGKDSGHIFNLGHGIDKEVNPDHLRAMIQAVKKHSVR